ncbi:MAG: serine/threonine protein kinase, partial [Candidatus Eisenbacteria bacterium]|nr:serine/threonine protein kinase [Candidatus Eisenbacteria bacterium]
MTTPPPYDPIAVFLHAISLPPEERSAYLIEATGSDEEKIREQEKLIAAHENPAGPLDAGFIAVDPESIGSYRIIGRLGEGGMGVVYEAVHKKLDSWRVAVKVLAPELSRDESWIARFHREAQILAGLDHSHIATLFDFGDDDGRYYVAMQLIDGPTLAEYLADGAPSPPVAIDLLVGIAEGLVEAHAHGIVHRDLKPQNILIHPTQGAKIVDFGIATSVGEIDRLSSGRMPGTAVTSVIGTWEYASPEQRLRTRSDERSDIWSFGCLAYECVTGKRAFPPRGGPTIQEPDWKSVPPAMKTLIEGCLRPEREDRWQQMSVVLAQLRALLPDLNETRNPAQGGSAGEGTPTPPNGHGPSAPFSNHPGRAIRYAALAAVV